MIGGGLDFIWALLLRGPDPLTWEAGVVIWRVVIWQGKQLRGGAENRSHHAGYSSGVDFPPNVPAFVPIIRIVTCGELTVRVDAR